MYLLDGPLKGSSEDIMEYLGSVMREMEGRTTRRFFFGLVDR